MGLISPDFDAFLRRLLEMLEPYLSDLVVIGGTGNALYRAHPLAAAAPGDHVPAGASDDQQPSLR